MTHRILYFVGIDVAANTFAASVYHPDRRHLTTEPLLANTEKGILAFIAWLHAQKCTAKRTVVCMEATGVYGLELATRLVAAGYRVAVEPPLKVKRAFQPGGPKSDPVDSRQIAEYACRFADELTFWMPPSDVVAEIQMLLAMRERLNRDIVMHKNAMAALEHTPRPSPTVQRMTDDLLQVLEAKKQAIDEEIRALIRQDPTLRQKVSALDSIPGVGLLLAAHLLVLTRGFEVTPAYRSTAAHLGIAPLEHTSGTSLRARSASRGYGPPQIRCLLHLAARSVATHVPEYQAYYQRLLAVGKPRRLVLNNIANRLLRVICAVSRSGAPYDARHRSINPGFLTAH